MTDKPSSLGEAITHLVHLLTDDVLTASEFEIAEAVEEINRAHERAVGRYLRGVEVGL